MKQLTGIDNFFINSERGNVYNHVAALGIYDPSTAPSGKVRFKEILEHFRQRVMTTPSFRRRLVTVPFGLDRPYWVDSPDLDIEFHIRHIALPHPGDWRQLMIQVARIHSRPLDRSRPLWEIYVIEGLDNIPDMPAGAFALFSKFHHSQMDGNATARVLFNLHADSATPAVPSTETATVITERDPLTPELYARALGNTVRRAAGFARFVAKTSGKVASIAAKVLAERANRGDGTLDMDAVKAAIGHGKAPQTRFNTKLSANRSVDAAALPLDQVKTIRSAFPDTTVNDIFLSVCGGALRHYLESKGELPSAGLRGLMPISVRKAGKAEGNEVGGVAVLLHSEIADPIERLMAVQRDAVTAKGGAAVVGPDLVQAIYNELPFAASNFLIRHMVFDQLNCTVSNVRGPDIPLYVAGARAVHMYPVSIPIDGVGVNFTGFSYNGVMWISCVSCRNMVPDPAFLADCLRQAGAELLAAAQRKLAAEAVPRVEKSALAARHNRAKRVSKPIAKVIPSKTKSVKPTLRKVA
jgi:WS/DGAT/MGAT family acyltransferase